jgi:hypothetical protein
MCQAFDLHQLAVEPLQRVVGVGVVGAGFVRYVRTGVTMN